MASTLPPDRPPGPISSTGADTANTPETDNGADVQPQTPKGSPSFQPSGLSERTVEQSENIHPQMKSGEELAAHSKEKLQELLNDSRLSNSYRRQAESKQIDSVKDLLNDVSGAVDWYSGNAAENFRSVVSEMMARKPKLEKLSIVMNIPPQYRDVHLVPPGDDLERCEGDLEQILNIAKQMADGLGIKNQAEITDNDDKRVMEEGVQSFESILKHLDPDSRQDAFNQFRAFQNPRVEIGVNWSDLSNNSAWQPLDLSRCPPHLKPKEAEFDLTSEPDFEAPFVDERLDQLQAQLRSEALKAGGDLTETQLAATEANIAGMGKTAKELMHTEQHIPEMSMFNSDEGLQPPKHQDNGDPSSTRAPAKKRGPESSEEMARREDPSRSGKKPRAGDDEYERTLGDSRLPRDVEDEDDDAFGPNQTYTPNRRGRLSRSSGDDDTPKSPVFRGPPPPLGGRDGQPLRYPPEMEENLTRVLHARQRSAANKTSFPYTDRRSAPVREHGVKSGDTRARFISSVSSEEDDFVHVRKPEDRRDPSSSGLPKRKDTDDMSSLFESSNPGESVRSSGSSSASQSDRYLESHRRQSTDLRQMDTDQQQWFEDKEAWRLLSPEEQVSLHQQTSGNVVPTHVYDEALEIVSQSSGGDGISNPQLPTFPELLTRLSDSLDSESRSFTEDQRYDFEGRDNVFQPDYASLSGGLPNAQMRDDLRDDRSMMTESSTTSSNTSTSVEYDVNPLEPKQRGQSPLDTSAHLDLRSMENRRRDELMSTVESTSTSTLDSEASKTPKPLEKFEVKDDGAGLMRALLAHHSYETRWLQDATAVEVVNALRENGTDEAIKESMSESITAYREFLSSVTAEGDERRDELSPALVVHSALSVKTSEEMAEEMYQSTIETGDFNHWSYHGLAKALDIEGFVGPTGSDPYSKHLEDLANVIFQKMFEKMSIDQSDGATRSGVKLEGKYYSLFVPSDYFSDNA